MSDPNAEMLSYRDNWDYLQVLRLAEALAPERTRAVAVEHEGQPLPKDRPRLGRHVYTTPKTAAAEAALAMRIRAGMRGRVRFPGNVALIAIFYRKDRTIVDEDNLLKLVMDAATKAGIWRDDSQMTAHAVRTELDRERPRTVLLFCDAQSSLVRKVSP